MKRRGAAGERSGLVFCGKSSLTQGSRGADAESAFFSSSSSSFFPACVYEREREREHMYICARFYLFTGSNVSSGVENQRNSHWPDIGRLSLHTCSFRFFGSLAIPPPNNPFILSFNCPLLVVYFFSRLYSCLIAMMMMLFCGLSPPPPSFPYP